MHTLPRFPQHEKREAENEKQNETLGIHHGSGNRIDAAGMPRAAAADAAHGQPAASPGAVPAQRFFRILRAARMEPAGGGQQRADAPAIAQHRQAKCPGDHFKVLSSSRTRLSMADDPATP